MTLIDGIKKAKQHAGSPPPELEENFTPVKIKRKCRYAHIRAKVDSSSPLLEPGVNLRNLETWKHQFERVYRENVYLIMLIKKAHFMRGRVDCHWTKKPLCPKQHYQLRVDFLKRIHRENLALYKLIQNTPSRVVPTLSLNQEWARNRRKIVEQANNTFVLFPPVPHEELEDRAFLPKPNVKRPRVYITLGIKDGAVLGEICVELFTDVCPDTCRLFLELLDGDTLGHGYIGTRFFRKIPHLYWSGGDVIYNNGFGCYAQRGRIVPIGAENYHFPHSMAGLLSMRVTIDDEMCGIFNITFKPLPQLDLHNVVFGRVIRPCNTYTIMRDLGNALSPRPVIELRSCRRKLGGRWFYGVPNTRLIKRSSGHLRQIIMAE